MSARRVERVLDDDEQVAGKTPQNDRAIDGPGLRIDIGVRRQQADPPATARDDEVGVEALRALRPGGLRYSR